jgi:hypothetical protein
MFRSSRTSAWVGCYVLPKTYAKWQKCILKVHMIINNSKSSILWDVTQCRQVKTDQHFGGTHGFHFQGRKLSQVSKQHEADCKQSFMLVSYLANSSSLKMGATYSSETSAVLSWTIRCYISEDRKLFIVTIVRN